MRAGVSVPLTIASLVLGGAGAPACSSPKETSPAIGIDGPRSARAELVRGDFTERVLLTGELDAVSSETLVVPRTPQWNLAIRWLEADGKVVTAGQKVAEFDNSAFTNNLAERKLAAVQSANDLENQIAQNAITTADKRFELDKARIALEKARREAAVDPSTLPGRVFQQKKLEEERAEVALAKAIDDMEAHVKSAELDIRVKKLALEKAQREIAAAEAAIESVVLRAPRDGILVIADHPWEGRKLEPGDNLWVGIPVVRLPDFRKMKVNALLSDVDDGRVSVGMRANAYLDAYPDMAIPGTVTEISPVASEPSQRSWRRSFLVTMTLDDSTSASPPARKAPDRMIPGISVRVEVIGHSQKDALLAPRGSVDVSAKPPRLRLSDGTTVELESARCNAQSCAIAAPNTLAGRVREGTLVSASSSSSFGGT